MNIIGSLVLISWVFLNLVDRKFHVTEGGHGCFVRNLFFMVYGGQFSWLIRLDSIMVDSKNDTFSAYSFHK